MEVIAAFNPGYLRLGRVPKGTTKTETVKVETRDPGKFKITGIRPSNPDRVSVKLNEGKEGVSLQVTVKAGDKEGRLSESVVATTNLESPKEIRLQISGTVSEDLWADPIRTFFADFNEKKPPTTSVRISSLSGRAFKLKGVRDETGAVTGKIERSEGGWNVSLLLTRKPEKKSGTIRIKTDRKDQPFVDVPYSVGIGSKARSRTDRKVRTRMERVPQPVRMRTPPPAKPK